MTDQPTRVELFALLAALYAGVNDHDDGTDTDEDTRINELLERENRPIYDRMDRPEYSYSHTGELLIAKYLQQPEVAPEQQSHIDLLIAVAQAADHAFEAYATKTEEEYYWLLDTKERAIRAARAAGALPVRGRQ